MIVTLIIMIYECTNVITKCGLFYAALISLSLNISIWNRSFTGRLMVSIVNVKCKNFYLLDYFYPPNLNKYECFSN